MKGDAKEKTYFEITKLADQISVAIPFSSGPETYTNVCTELKKALDGYEFDKKEIVQLGAFKFCLAFMMENAGFIFGSDTAPLNTIIETNEVSEMLNSFTKDEGQSCESVGKELMDSIADGENVYYNAAVYRGTDR
jgi:hypothetical protein